MKIKLLVLTILLFLIFPQVYGADTETKPQVSSDKREEIIQLLEERDEYSDYMFQKMLKSKREENIFRLDRELGFLTTLDGQSFYVKRVPDPENYQMKIIDIKTGKQLTTLPYISIDNYTIDETGEYYITVLEDGTTIKIPIFINEGNYNDITITDADGNPVDLNYSPIYSDFGIIGTRLKISDGIYIDFKNPLYGSAGVSLLADWDTESSIKSLYEKEMFSLKFEYELTLDDFEPDDDENGKKDGKEDSKNKKNKTE